mmetsp:Transcript_43996/g.44666  ORF Transcript_43996/g.44666 Transcript_43996/m.44666 type:complete len:128 (-) Transcript_43996:30-413(-)
MKRTKSTKSSKYGGGNYYTMKDSAASSEWNDAALLSEAYDSLSDAYDALSEFSDTDTDVLDTHWIPSLMRQPYREPGSYPIVVVVPHRQYHHHHHQQLMKRYGTNNSIYTVSFLFCCLCESLFYVPL